METIDMRQDLTGRHGWYRTVPVLYQVTNGPIARPSPLRLPACPTQEPAAKRLCDAVNARVAEIRVVSVEQFRQMYSTPPLAHILFAEIPVLSGAHAEGGPVRVLMSVVDGQLLLLQRVKGHASFFRAADDGRTVISGLAKLGNSLQELEKAVQARNAEAEIS